MARGKSANPIDETTEKTAPTPESKNEEPPESEPVEDESVPKFSKEQLLKSNWYSHRRDILRALLEDGKMYSHAAVDKLIKSFSERKVK